MLFAYIYRSRNHIDAYCPPVSPPWSCSQAFEGMSGIPAGRLHMFSALNEVQPQPEELRAFVGLACSHGVRTCSLTGLLLRRIQTPQRATGCSLQSLRFRYGRQQSRIAAQVVSGIGFPGAGSILPRGKVGRGLTTAASLFRAE
ncbi:MgtC/SapB family protein [Paraburkholderia sacchari]|uniref:MgtC/SapB family protein n=1 Tax=Paraburkholderia sacchari TaxID=159450 RepID=UPI003D980FA6